MDGIAAYKLLINKNLSDKAESFLTVHTLSIKTAEKRCKPVPVYKIPKQVVSEALSVSIYCPTKGE